MKQIVANWVRSFPRVASIRIVWFSLTVSAIISAEPIPAAKPLSEPHAVNNWPQWRGPNRDGVVSGFSIPKAWPESLNRQWSVEVGQGHSSQVVADGLVYQHSREADEEHVRCLKLETGETVWHASYPASGGVHTAAASHGIGPKSTPVVDQGKLYTLGIGSILSCFEAKDLCRSVPETGSVMRDIDVAIDRRQAMCCSRWP